MMWAVFEEDLSLLESSWHLNDICFTKEKKINEQAQNVNVLNIITKAMFFLFLFFKYVLSPFLCV